MIRDRGGKHIHSCTRRVAVSERCESDLRGLKMILVLATTAASSRRTHVVRLRDMRNSRGSNPGGRCRGGGAASAQKCSEWRSGRRKGGQQPGADAGRRARASALAERDATCARPPPGDYELELCAKLSGARRVLGAANALLSADAFARPARSTTGADAAHAARRRERGVPFPRGGAPRRGGGRAGAAVGVVANDSTAVTAECIHASPRILPARRPRRRRRGRGDPRRPAGRRPRRRPPPRPPSARSGRLPRDDAQLDERGAARHEPARGARGAPPRRKPHGLSRRITSSRSSSCCATCPGSSLSRTTTGSTAATCASSCAAASGG